jgi:hypothetical protein
MRTIQPDNTVAEAGLKQIRHRAQHWYLQGYKLEYQDLKAAISCWHKVVATVPSNTKCHRLAQAKLHEYRNS